MAQPRELAYKWRMPVAVSSVGLVAGVAILARSQVIGRLSATLVLVVKVTQMLTSRGPSYRLTVRQRDGRLARYGGPTALLRRAHSTLFDWILTWAPQAELDKGSRRTLQTLRERDALPYPEDPDEPFPDKEESHPDIRTDESRADQPRAAQSRADQRE